MSKQFKAVFKDNTYNFLIGSDNDDKMTFAYSGTVSTVYRESGRATTIWIVIPVLGGYIVVKIRIESKMLEWDLQMRKVILTPRGDLQLKTIKQYYADGDKSEILIGTTTVLNSIDITIQGVSESHSLKIDCVNIPKSEDKNFEILEEPFGDIKANVISKK